MGIKVRITGKSEFYRKSEYYEPTDEIIVELDVDDIEDVDQEMISEAISSEDSVDWEVVKDKEILDDIEYFFEEIDEDELNDNEDDDELDEDEEW